MTHTPGPWFSIATSNIGHNAVVDADGFTICSPSPMGAGNARLIAAAPDLLDMCERLLGFAYHYGSTTGILAGDGMLTSAKALIAKAKGGGA